MKLMIVDFDGTLRHTQVKPPEDFLPGKRERLSHWMLTPESVQGSDIPSIISVVKKAIADSEMKVYLVTSRPYRSRKLVLSVLQSMGLKFERLFFETRNKHEVVKEFLDAYPETDTVVAIDDTPRILDGIRQIIPKSVRCETLIPPQPKTEKPEAIIKINPIQSAHKLLHRLDLLGVEDVIVGYSGGKDSLATLDVCVQHFGAQHVKAFFLYTLPDLECESALADFPTKRYGIEVLKLPLPSMMDMIRNGFGRYTSPSLQQLLDRKYTWNEVEKIARNKLKARWICYGHRMQDSLQRRGMLTRCNGVWETAYKTGKLIQRAYPLWQWNHKMVFSYLETHRLPIPHMFGAGDINTSGLSLVDPDILLYVKEHYPNDFRRLKRVFPQLETPIFRQEVLQRSFAQMEESPTEKQETSPITLQQTSELFETEVAKILKLQKTRNNFAVDWIGVDGQGNEIGIELKVLNKAEDNQSRVQMRPSARKRKLAWIAADPLHRKGCTILIDNRDNYAGGAYQQFYSGHRIYWAGDFGAFRIDSMTKVSSLSHLVQKLWPKSSPDLGDVNRKFAELMERTYGNRG